MIVINLREGRTGNSECIFTLVIGLCMSGLFAFDSYDAYAGGNSTYLSLPIACLLAMTVFLLCSFSMKKTRSSDLNALITYSVGKLTGTIICMYIALLIIACICQLTDKFLNVMYSYFFQDSSYYSIGIYFLTTMVILAMMGFETINRTSKVMGVILILVLILLLVNSYSSYDTYKIYPIAGDGMDSMLSFSVSSVVLFLPAFVSGLITAKGMHGIQNASKNALRATIITVVICGITQVFLSLSYTYDNLSKLYMPLYRMSMVTGAENFIVRLDKISVFIWVTAALLAGSYYLYSASLLFCRAFRQTDIRPCVLSFGIMVILLCLITNSGLHVFSVLFKLLNKYGSLLLGIPLVIISIFALMKNAINEKKLSEGRTE